MRSGKASTPNSGRPRKIRGSFCGRFPERRSSLCWQRPNFVNVFRIVYAITVNPSAEDAWFQKKYPGSAPLARRLLQHGIHVDRGVAHLFGRTRQCSRRSDEGREQPGRARCRHRAALWSGIFPPGFRCGRQPTGALPGQRSGPTAHPATASGQWRMAEVADPVTRIEDLASLLGGLCGKNQTLPSRRQRLRQ